MSDLTFERLREVSARRAIEAYPNMPNGAQEWPVEVWALAIAGEAGELAQWVKRRLTGERAVSDLTIFDEIADVVIYCDLLATRMGVRLEDLVKSKFNRTSNKIKWQEDVL